MVSLIACLLLLLLLLLLLAQPCWTHLTVHPTKNTLPRWAASPSHLHDHQVQCILALTHRLATAGKHPAIGSKHACILITHTL
jgi:hypothetical protein